MREWSIPVVIYGRYGQQIVHASPILTGINPTSMLEDDTPVYILDRFAEEPLLSALRQRRRTIQHTVDEL